MLTTAFVSTKDELLTAIRLFDPKNISPPDDGLILEYNDKESGQSMRSTGHHENYCIAFIWADTAYKTIFRGELLTVAKEVRIIKPMDEAKDNPFKSKTIVASGSLQHFTCDGINQKLVELGAKPSDSVSKKTHYVIVCPGAGSKLTKVTSHGIPILTEEEFLAML